MASSTKKRAFAALLTNIARLLLSAVLMVSGFVKAVDPMGFTYKLQEYLAAFGLTGIDEGWILAGALSLSAAEFIMGVLLLMGVYTSVATFLTFLFFLFFTPFTLVLAVWNPVHDCGCFGDALQLSNEATFAKNAVLLVCATMVWFRRRLFIRRISPVNRWMVSLFAFCYIALVEGVSLSHLPVMDFRPFAVGSNLRSAVVDIPSEIKVLYRFEKDGQVQEFDDETYPDSTWNYLGSSSYVIKQGQPALIADFAFMDMATGDDYAPAILEDSGYVCIVVINRIETADESRVDKINDLYDYCVEQGVPFFAATSSEEEDVELWRKRTGAEYSMLWADEVMLKTIVRSNPGVLLIKDGRVAGKWNVNDLPSVEQFHESPTAMPDKAPSIYRYIRGWKQWVLLLVVPLLLISLVDVATMRRRKSPSADDVADDNTTTDKTEDKQQLS